MVGGAQAYEQGGLSDDDPEIVEGMAQLAALRVLEEIEDRASPGLKIFRSRS